jgi:ATP-binding cassette subfamily B protein
MRRFYEFLRRRLAIRWRASLAMTAMWITTLAVFTAGTAAAFALGAALWNAGAVSIGTVYLIFYYTELLRRPIEQIRTQLQDLQRADASIARVEGLLATHSRLADGPGRPLLPGPLAVEVDRVSFSYEDGNEDSGAPGGGRPGERALHDVNFGLAPGAVLGLLGRTGSGKTTLARLLLRLYDPTAGEIRLSGVPLRAQRLADLRRHVALVTQDVQLFHATVRDNLTFFDRAISDAQLLAVVEELGLGDWYSRLPAGLDSPLAAGTGLSAGEAQLLAFVRVFLKDPGLVILDEASARLDPATEQLLDRAIARLLSGRTGIIIAHRLSTLQRAGQIMILEHGRILEHGDRAELAAAPDSRFHALLRAGLEEVLA